MIACSVSYALPSVVIVAFWLGLISNIKRRYLSYDEPVQNSGQDYKDIRSALKAFSSRIDWAAYEAQVANLRSEALSHKLSELEEELSRIREHLASAFEVSLELDKRLGDSIREKAPKPKKLHRNGVVTADVPVVERKLSHTEMQVINLLSSSDGMLAKDMQNKLNMSREHVSRLLGGLVEMGVLTRYRKGRQFLYKLKKEAQNTANQEPG